MKKYIILHRDEINKDIIKELGVGEARTFTNILDLDEVDTGLRVVSINSDEYPNSLVMFRKFTQEEISDRIEKIQSGSNIDRYCPNQVKMSAFANPEGKRARFTGGFKLTATSGQTVTQDFLVTEDRYITGAKYWVEGSNFGDKVDFDVIHPVYGISVDQFIGNWYVWDGSEQMDTYAAKIPAGMILRLTYYNTGGTTANFIANMFLHKV